MQTSSIAGQGILSCPPSVSGFLIRWIPILCSCFASRRTVWVRSRQGLIFTLFCIYVFCLLAAPSLCLSKLSNPVHDRLLHCRLRPHSPFFLLLTKHPVDILRGINAHAVAAGIGVTPFSAILKEIRVRYLSGVDFPLRRVFVFSRLLSFVRACLTLYVNRFTSSGRRATRRVSNGLLRCSGALPSYFLPNVVLMLAGTSASLRRAI